MAVIIVIASEV